MKVDNLTFRLEIINLNEISETFLFAHQISYQKNCDLSVTYLDHLNDYQLILNRYFVAMGYLKAQSAQDCVIY